LSRLKCGVERGNGAKLRGVLLRAGCVEIGEGKKYMRQLMGVKQKFKGRIIWGGWALAGGGPAVWIKNVRGKNVIGGKWEGGKKAEICKEIKKGR